jgi:hypothetical protein
MIDAVEDDEQICQDDSGASIIGGTGSGFNGGVTVCKIQMGRTAMRIFYR